MKAFKQIVIIGCLCWATLQADISSKNIHKYIWANYHQFGGNAQEAQKWYSQLSANNAPIYN